MNLWARRVGWAALAALPMVCFNSCEDPGSIGLNVDPQANNIGSFFKELDLPTSVVQFNPRRTTEANSIQAGKYLSLDFGTITSRSYTQLAVVNVPSISDTAVFTGFDLSLQFDNVIGQPLLSGEDQEILIYQLATDLDTLGDYTRLSDADLMPSPLGSIIFAPSLNDTLQTDSLYTVPLDDVFGADLFEKLKNGDNIFDSNKAFNDYIHGLAFLPGVNAKVIFQFNILTLRLNIHYNEYNSDGTPVDRFYSMGIGPINFYHIDADASTTPISNLQANNTDFFPPNDMRYLQYGTLIALKIDLSPFFGLSDTIQNLVINKAEVDVGPLEPFSENMNPPDVLNAYFTDASNQWPIVVDTSSRYNPAEVGRFHVMLQRDDGLVQPGSYSFPQSITYDDNDRMYHISMSFFLQALTSGKFHNPSSPYIEEQGKLYLFGGTDVILPQKRNSHKLTSGFVVSKSNIKLNLHYSIPQQSNSGN